MAHSCFNPLRPSLAGESLASRVITATNTSIIRALNRVGEIAGNSGGRCAPALQTLVLRTNLLVSLLARPLNGGPPALTLDDPVRAARDWLAAFSETVLCLDDGGIPLLGAARGVLDTGLSLIGLLQKFLNVGDLPRLVRS